MSGRNRWTEGLTKKTKTIILATIVIVAGSLAVLTYALAFNLSQGQPTTSTTQGPQLSTTTTSTSTAAYYTKYLGYLPAGYPVATREPSAPIFPCPAGMDSAQCQLFQQTCGNGVCDPNERCNTCPFDCSVTGALICDPYTGRASAPASVCQITPQQPPQAQTSG